MCPPPSYCFLKRLSSRHREKKFTTNVWIIISDVGGGMYGRKKVPYIPNWVCHTSPTRLWRCETLYLWTLCNYQYGKHIITKSVKFNTWQWQTKLMFAIMAPKKNDFLFRRILTNTRRKHKNPNLEITIGAAILLFYGGVQHCLEQP